jgi:membrane-associated phospholipid phosphatase
MSTKATNLRWDWAAVGLLFLADGLLLLTTNFRLLWRPEFFILAAAAFLLLLAFIYSTIRDAPNLANMASIGSLLVLFTSAVAVLNYILYGTFPLQLWDARFDAADKIFGLNWLAFYQWSTAHAALNTASTIIYFSLSPEVILLFLLLEGTGRHQRSIAFWRQFAAGALITVGFGILMPAAGPFVFYHLPVAAHTGYVAQEAALRNGSMRLIDLGHIEGLVCFPSFHTTLALVCAYAAWPLRFAAWPFLLLNILIILSAPVIGGHYFVDIIAGAVLAGLIIVAEQKTRN